MTLVNGKALVFSVPVTMTCEILGSSGPWTIVCRTGEKL